MSKLRNLFIFGGPSGSGKTYVANMLEMGRPGKFHRMHQCTTREMREGEKEGDPYLFIDDKEWARIYSQLIFTSVRPHAKYGTLSNCLDLNKHQIVIADVNALKQIAEESYTFARCYELFETIYIIGFVYDPNKSGNEYRMKGRENRDNSFYFEFNKYADFVFENESDNFLTIDDAYSQLTNLYYHTDHDDYAPEVVRDRLKRQFGL